MKNQSNINEDTTGNITESLAIIHRCKQQQQQQQQHHTYLTINRIASLWEYHGRFLFFNNIIVEMTVVVNYELLAKTNDNHHVNSNIKEIQR